MGSQLTKNYDISKEPIAFAGPNKIWKIHSATKKGKIRSQVSIFILEKKFLEKESRQIKEELLSQLRKEAQSLAKLKHPGILFLVEPLLEDTKLMAFVTEPIETSLISLIENNPSSTHLSLIPSEIELKSHILQLTETIHFIHDTAKIIHLAISPSNLYLTNAGNFKIAGFLFSQQAFSDQVNAALNHTPYANNFNMLPELNFTAPEVTIEGVCSVKSDLFSIGCLIYTMYMLSQNASSRSIYYLDLNQAERVAKHIEACKKLQAPGRGNKLSMIPTNIANLLEKLLKFNPDERGSLLEIRKHSYFEDPLIKTINYLEHLEEKEHHHKVQFLGGLSKVLHQFDSKILVKKIIPVLMKSLQNEKLSCHILPSLTQVLERENILSKNDFQTKVWPLFSKMCKGREIPAQSLYIIINNTETFVRVIHIQDFQSTVLPLYQKALECGVAKIQEICLKKIPCFARKIEYVTLKSAIIPRVLHLMETTNYAHVRIQCLECLTQFYSFLDTATVKNSILTSFEKIKKIESDCKFCIMLLKMIEGRVVCMNLSFHS